MKKRLVGESGSMTNGGTKVVKEVASSDIESDSLEGPEEKGSDKMIKNGNPLEVNNIKLEANGNEHKPRVFEEENKQEEEVVESGHIAIELKIPVVKLYPEQKQEAALEKNNQQS